MLWYDVVETEVDHLIETNITIAGLLAQTQQRMKSGFYTSFETEYVDAMFQNWQRGYSLYDAFSFLSLHAAVAHGQIARAQIYVGATPLADSCIQQNHELLQNIPLPFRASFHGGNRDEDGALWWDASVLVTCTPKDNTAADVEIAPRRVRLEVGYQSAKKTLMQLKVYRHLARWPYGSKWIHLFAVLDESW